MKKWRRLFLALLVPLGLFILGLFLLKFLGTGVSGSIADLLNTWWLPITAARLLVYGVLAYGLLPLWLGKQYDQLTAQYQQCQAQLGESENDNDNIAYHCRMLQARQQRCEQLLSRKCYLFIMLLAFDALTIQLPFWLR